jgi:hypothetical protein
MISLLHEKDYEMLGNIEIRQPDWTRISQMGMFRFVVKSCSASLGGQIGTFLLCSVGLGHIDPLRRLGGGAWVALVYGVWCLGCSAIHAIRAWHRLEQRFNRAVAG